MPGELTGMEVQILYILYRNKCFKASAGYHSEKLKRILRKKYADDFDAAVANLGRCGYIAAVKKDEPKYYIADLGSAYAVLEKHGLNVAPLGGGRTHHLD
jgi:hypothetical protein